MRDPPRASRELAGGASDRFFVSTYLDFVRLPSARSAFGELYRRLAVEETHPALVHCTTGKDRTGWAVAVLLLWLGVDDETVMADYLAQRHRDPRGLRVRRGRLRRPRWRP